MTVNLKTQETQQDWSTTMSTTVNTFTLSDEDTNPFARLTDSLPKWQSHPIRWAYVMGKIEDMLAQQVFPNSAKQWDTDYTWDERADSLDHIEVPLPEELPRFLGYLLDMLTEQLGDLYSVYPSETKALALATERLEAVDRGTPLEAVLLAIHTANTVRAYLGRAKRRDVGELLMGDTDATDWEGITELPDGYSLTECIYCGGSFVWEGELIVDEDGSNEPMWCGEQCRENHLAD